MTAGTDVYVRTGLTTAGKYPRGFCKSAKGEAAYDSSVATSQIYQANLLTMPSGGVESDQYDSGAYSAYALIGKPVTPIPSILISGDSIADGLGDYATSDLAGNFGFIARGLWNAARGPLPYSKSTEGGDSFQGNLFSRAPHRRVTWSYATHCVTNMGTNSIAGGTSNLAAIQAAAIAYWQSLRRYGLKIAHCTIMPRTTDATNTVIYDSQYLPGGTKDQFNAWLYQARDSGLIDWVIDSAALVSAPGGTGFWFSPGTTRDGLHPSAAGHAAAAAAVTTWANTL